MDFLKSQLRMFWLLFVVLLGAGLGAAWVAAQPAESVPSETLSGWFHTLWVDDFEHPENSTIRHFITDDAGQEIELEVSDVLLQQHGGIRGLSGQRVKVTVEAPALPPPGLETVPPAAQKRKLLAIQPLAGASSGVMESMAGNDGSGSVADRKRGQPEKGTGYFSILFIVV